MTSELWQMDARQIRSLVAAGAVSAVEVARACLDRINRSDPTIRAFTATYPELALARAEEIDRGRERWRNAPLLGVPYAIKDTTETAGIVTTFGSAAYRDHVPAVDAAVARRMAESGGVFLGKTNTPEFARRATTAFGLFPATRNPWNPVATAGGSSGGSAAAVAARMCPLAEGGDAGGSVRIPASCCGVVGMKPSRGRVSEAPSAGRFSTLFTHGSLTRTVRDAALMLDVMHGPEIGDPYWLERPSQPYDALEDRVAPRRIAVLTHSEHPVDSEVVATVTQTADALTNLGHLVDEGGPNLDGLGWILDLLARADAAAHPPPGLEFSDPYCRMRYEQGLGVGASEYVRAHDEMYRRAREIVAFFTEWDCLLTPTATNLPPPVDQFLANLDTAAAEDLAFISFTYPFNMTGQPAISIPTGLSRDGLPVGVQLVGRPGEDSSVLAVAAQVERAIPWETRWPPTGPTTSGGGFP